MSLTVLDCYTRLGFEPKKHGRGSRGREMVGPCPGCHGKDRFIIFLDQNDGTGSYHCRDTGNGCGASGDVIQFLRDFEGMSFQDASLAAGRDASALPMRSAPKMPKRDKADGIQAQALEEATPTWMDKATAFAAHCHEQLLDNAEQMAWLARRGLPREAVIRYGLGWNGCDGKLALYRPRKVWDLPEELNDNGKPKMLWLPRGLVIPARDASGRVYRLRFRRTEQDREASGIEAKFYVVPGSGKSPVYLEQLPGTLPPSSCCIGIESDLDAYAVHYHAGDLTAVLSLMTAKVRFLPPEIMHKLKACSCILSAQDVGDKDAAGAKGAAVLANSFDQARRWACIGGKDPGAMAEAGKSLRIWIMAGLPDTLLAMAKSKTQDGVTQPSPVPAADNQGVAPVNSAILTGGGLRYGDGPLPEITFGSLKEKKDLPPLRIRLLGSSPFIAALALATLTVRGITPRLTKEDYVLYGHERLWGDDLRDLAFFIRHNGDHVLRALELKKAEAQA